MSRCAMHGTRAVLGLAAFLAAGCVTAGGKAPAQTESAAATVAPQPPARPAAAAGTGESAVTPSADFTSWRNGFRQRALAAGISAATFDAAFKGVRVNARVLELNAYQPEFVRPIWEYLEKAVSDTRIADGLARSAEQRATLARIRDQYGVDLGIVAAIWVSMAESRRAATHGARSSRGISLTSAMFKSMTRTRSASWRMRAPPHSRHGRGLWYCRRKTRMYCL